MSPLTIEMYNSVLIRVKIATNERKELMCQTLSWFKSAWQFTSAEDYYKIIKWLLIITQK